LVTSRWRYAMGKRKGQLTVLSETCRVLGWCLLSCQRNRGQGDVLLKASRISGLSLDSNEGKEEEQCIFQYLDGCYFISIILLSILCVLWYAEKSSYLSRILSEFWEHMTFLQFRWNILNAVKILLKISVKEIYPCHWRKN
jgi:hypothetical protein